MYILVEEYNNNKMVIVQTRDIRRVYSDVHGGHYIAYYNEDLRNLEIKLSPKDFFEKYKDELNAVNS